MHVYPMCKITLSTYQMQQFSGYRLHLFEDNIHVTRSIKLW